jgi:radical SAM superfamily enzyme YgiQ (UPF0313 family)
VGSDVEVAYGRYRLTFRNPNKIRLTITPYALDLLTTSLEESGYDIEVVDLNFHRDEWRAALAGYFEHRRPLLVGITMRNTDTIYPQEQKVFVGEHREIIAEIRRLTGAPLVVGGVGFSSMPFALVDYFGVDYGVKGPGELIICRLADALLTAGSPRDVSGLIINEGGGSPDRCRCPRSNARRRRRQ